MFSSADNLGFTSSRYLGTQPVTARTSTISLVGSVAAFSPQNETHSSSGSSRRSMSREKRPPNSALSRRFLLIQLETLPHTTRIKRSWCLTHGHSPSMISGILYHNLRTICNYHFAPNFNIDVFVHCYKLYMMHEISNSRIWCNPKTNFWGGTPLSLSFCRDVR